MYVTHIIHTPLWRTTGVNSVAKLPFFCLIVSLTGLQGQVHTIENNIDFWVSFLTWQGRFPANILYVCLFAFIYLTLRWHLKGGLFFFFFSLFFQYSPTQSRFLSLIHYWTFYFSCTVSHPWMWCVFILIYIWYSKLTLYVITRNTLDFVTWLRRCFVVACLTKCCFIL